MLTFIAPDSGTYEITVDTTEPIEACLFVNYTIPFVLKAKTIMLALIEGDIVSGFEGPFANEMRIISANKLD